MAALGGGATGFLSSLKLECPDLSARCIDLPNGCADDDALGILRQELALDQGRVEVGYPGQVRHVFDSAPLDMPKAPSGPADPQGPILATGGVRGITAAFLHALARPGTPLIVVGRSPAPDDEPEHLAACPDLPALRKALAEAALASGSGQRPAEIEAAARRILRDRAARAALAALRDAGFMVDCRACDLRDPQAVAALIDAVTDRHGPIRTLVHGAGVIEDQLIADKTAASFDRVVDTKIAALPVLLDNPKLAGLARVVFFSSVAGRFGNRGQGDYAAANEVLNRAALWLKGARPNLDVLSFNWGPWAGGGMASDAVNALFRARDIIPIDPRSGIALGRAALAAGGPVELIAGAGDWNRDLVQEAWPATGARPKARTEEIKS